VKLAALGVFGFGIGVVSVIACGPGARNNVSDDTPGGPDACVGMQCDVVDCSGSAQSTTLEGYVYAPNGTLPLYGVNVYIPNSDPGPITTGLSSACDQCTLSPPGNPITLKVTDETGHFMLPNVPVVANMPVVIQIGKWRKILSIAQPVAKCAITQLPKIDTTLPAKMTESGGDIVSVDMPQMAVSTGALDGLECLLRKLGIADSEFTTATGSGRVHLYADVGATESIDGFTESGEGTDRFQSGFAGGSGMFLNSQALWGTATAGTDTLSKYDIAMFACEGAQFAASKPKAAMDAVKAFADGGGRLFLSHWHNIWLEGDTDDSTMTGSCGSGTPQPADWPAIACFTNAEEELDDGNDDTIDEVNNPKGSSFATWMQTPTVGGTTTRDLIPIVSGTAYNSCSSVDETKAEGWVYLDGTHTKPTGEKGVQNFQFSTPNDLPEGNRCGKVVFSDMHVSGDSTSSPGAPGFPTGCASGALTPQELALAFMFFDIESCVGPPIARVYP
jgi:hypothetical protein